jgi:hypothetical protein
MNIVVLDKTYMTEFPVANPGGGTSQQVLFPTLQNLDGKITQGLSTYSPSVISKTPGNNTPANDALIRCSYVNLFVGDENQIWNIPMSELMTIQRNNATPVAGGTQNFVPYKIEFNNLKFIWAKSFVFIGDITTIVAGEFFLFNILYADENTVMDKK